MGAVGAIGLRLALGIAGAARLLGREIVERGDDAREASLSGYERGEYAPSQERAALLDELLEADGELLAILGYAGGEDIVVTVQTLATKMARLEEKFDLLLSRIEQAADRGEIPEATAARPATPA